MTTARRVVTFLLCLGRSIDRFCHHLIPFSVFIWIFFVVRKKVMLLLHALLVICISFPVFWNYNIKYFVVSIAWTLILTWLSLVLLLYSCVIAFFDSWNVHFCQPFQITNIHCKQSIALRGGGGVKWKQPAGKCGERKGDEKSSSRPAHTQTTEICVPQ